MYVYGCVQVHIHACIYVLVNSHGFYSSCPWIIATMTAAINVTLLINAIEKAELSPKQLELRHYLWDTPESPSAMCVCTT